MPDSGSILDAGSLAGLLMRHAPAMRAYVSRRIPVALHGCINADDVLQDAWISVYKNAGTFRGTAPSSFQRWLTTIVAHQLASALRTAGRLRRGGGTPPAHEWRSSSLPDLVAQVAGAGDTPSRTVATREAVDAVLVAMALLPDDRRTVLRMRYVEGLTPEQAAERMGRSVASIASLTYHARLQLRELMGSASNFISRTGWTPRTASSS
jgi:RNA polymerase sigma-70 factor (ECF subfamily)